ncbi:hypothetical protein C8R44DRAFT_369188 [Mycena epipterygia]|nr:hypothetical protein C8R44DRAFT_369188 [Mycena epipterygia]
MSQFQGRLRDPASSYCRASALHHAWRLLHQVGLRAQHLHSLVALTTKIPVQAIGQEVEVDDDGDKGRFGRFGLSSLLDAQLRHRVGRHGGDGCARRDSAARLDCIECLQLAVLVAALPDCKPSPCIVQSHFPPRNASTSSSGAPNTPSSNFLLITGADLTRASRVSIHQDVLSTYHWPQKSADELVYLLKFNYDISGIPDANGPIYMHADVTDMPDYWDNIIELGVAAAPLQRRCARCGGRI